VSTRAGSDPFTGIEERWPRGPDRPPSLRLAELVRAGLTAVDPTAAAIVDESRCPPSRVGWDRDPSDPPGAAGRCSLGVGV